MNDEFPTHRVISLHDINFHNIIFPFIRLSMIITNGLLAKGNVISNLPTLNKSCLGLIDNVRQNMFKSVGKNFCNTFTDCIATLNKSIIITRHD